MKEFIKIINYKNLLVVFLVVYGMLQFAFLLEWNFNIWTFLKPFGVSLIFIILVILRMFIDYKTEKKKKDGKDI